MQTLVRTMRHLPWAILLSMTCPSAVQAVEAGALAAVQKQDIHLLGRLNINTARREELLAIPSLTEQLVDQLLEARSRGPLTSLASFQLPSEAAARLSLSGASTLRRIRPLPLETFTPTAQSATR